MKVTDIERTSDGKLPAYAWPGGYPVIYLDRDNSLLCAECATRSLDDPDEIPQFKPVAADVFYEGASQFCDGCNVEIESAYGDPDVESDG